MKDNENFALIHRFLELNFFRSNRQIVVNPKTFHYVRQFMHESYSLISEGWCPCLNAADTWVRVTVEINTSFFFFFFI